MNTLPQASLKPALVFHVVLIPEGSSFRMGTIAMRRLPLSLVRNPKDWSPRGEIPEARR